nr:MAG TPA: hypothetical protein [Bacteriophage sp.]
MVLINSSFFKIKVKESLEPILIITLIFFLRFNK